LDPKGDPRTTGWRSSQPIPWDGAPCANQIWWTPYLDGSAGRLIRFGWTFTTSIAGPTECMVSAYYPPPPSGHSGGTAHYTISGGGAPRPVTVVQADYKGTWHPLGTYRITSGRVDVTLDNTGADPTPWQGVIAGPIHVSCR
ncbi:MAG TPA: hypothetical protein VH352_16465, partial [Pseudonocardiaceae bacterium]|nr:hypothetical protein [Pseudonocardiaceae bacterium]